MNYKNHFYTFFNQSTNPIIMAAVILAVIWALIVSSGSETLRAAGEARVVFDFKDSDRVFEGWVGPSMSVFEAILVAAQAGDIPLEYSLNQKGEMVVERVDKYNLSENRIRISRNYQPVSLSAVHRYALKPGDVIRVTIQ